MNHERKAIRRIKTLGIAGVRPRLGMGRPQKRWLCDACDGADVTPHLGLRNLVAMLPQTRSDRRNTHRPLRQYGIRIRRKRSGGMEEFAQQSQMVREIVLWMPDDKSILCRQFWELGFQPLGVQERGEEKFLAVVHDADLILVRH